MIDLGGPQSVAVISDIHANGRALRAVHADLLQRGADALVVLGDLFSYGVDVAETFEVLDEMRAFWPTTFVIGNHDRIYLDLDENERGYLDGLPDWIKDSAAFTHPLVQPLAPRFDWCWRHRAGEVFLSHANANRQADWSYLNDDDALVDAAQKLSLMGARIGVFGHTHRPHISVVRDGKVTRADSPCMPEVGHVIINPGSVGQPRGGDSAASYARLTRDELSLHNVAYDTKAHVAGLRATTKLSSSTRDKLASFFAPQRAR